MSDVDKSFAGAISAVRDAAMLRALYVGRNERETKGEAPLDSEEIFQSMVGSIAQRIESALDSFDEGLLKLARGVSVNDLPLNIGGIVGTCAYEVAWKAVEKTWYAVYFLERIFPSDEWKPENYLHPDTVQNVCETAEIDVETIVAFLEKELDRIHESERVSNGASGEPDAKGTGDCNLIGSGEDVPPEFRDGGVETGAPLTASYLQKSTDWLLTAKNCQDAKGTVLTEFWKVGRAHAYRYDQLLQLRDRLTRRA